MEKVCSNCNQIKLFSEFHRRNDSSDGYAGRCKQCKKKQDSFQYLKTRDRRLRYQKTYTETNINSVTAYQKSWYKNNKSKAVALSNKRRARKLHATPRWLTKQDLLSIEIEYELARWCSTVMGIPYEVDHIVPLQGKTVCGLHVPWNLQVLPKTLNRLKSNKF